jgi:hypothetical protein
MDFQKYPEPAREPMTTKDKIIVVGMLITSLMFSSAILYGLYKIAKEIIFQ